MLKNTGSWMYCDACDKTVGYLCYSTYQSFRFEFNCKCGNYGHFDLKYNTDKTIKMSSIKLEKKKNRLCCPNDSAPLFTIVEKNIDSYSYSVSCNTCFNRFNEQAKE